MVFSSMVFIFLFLPLVCVLYYVFPWRLWRNVLLCATSLFFYAWGEPRYLLLMAASILVNYVLAFFVAPRKNSTDVHEASTTRATRLRQAKPPRKNSTGRADTLTSPTRLRKLALVLAVAVNLAFLAVFKYAGFAVSLVNSALSAAKQTVLPVPRIALPIGISFYTFQALSYVIDVYRGNARPQKNPLYVALYISLFPQLIAGPIVRYTDIEAEITGRHETLEGFAGGLALFMLGLSGKVLLANNLATVADGIYGLLDEAPASALWLGTLCYTFQIYFDFSGYSTMATGLGRMFGFTFQKNFNYPYTARSVTGFWRRWHMSLSGWFRDYVYIPLGGNRVTPARHILNLLIVWSLTGLWHGADMTFVLWGLYYGLLLIAEKYVFKGFLEKLPRAVNVPLTFLLVHLGWVLFRAETPADLALIVPRLFGFAGTTTAAPVVSTLAATTATAAPAPSFPLFVLSHAAMMSHAVFLVPAVIFSFPVVPALHRVLSKHRWGRALEFLACLALFALSVSFLEASTYNPFIYFRF